MFYMFMDVYGTLLIQSLHSGTLPDFGSMFARFGVGGGQLYSGNTL